jgi:hypothetical protein
MYEGQSIQHKADSLYNTRPRFVPGIRKPKQACYLISRSVLGLMFQCSDNKHVTTAKTQTLSKAVIVEPQGRMRDWRTILKGISMKHDVRM